MKTITNKVLFTLTLAAGSISSAAHAMPDFPAEGTTIVCVKGYDSFSLELLEKVEIQDSFLDQGYKALANTATADDAETLVTAQAIKTRVGVGVHYLAVLANGDRLNLKDIQFTSVEKWVPVAFKGQINQVHSEQYEYTCHYN